MKLKLGTLLAFSLVLILTLVATSYALPGACSDGTTYGACSKTQPGYYCGYDSTTGGSALQNVIGMTTASFKPCQCSKFDGYAEQNGECVKTSCTDANGASVGTNTCGSTKPKQCVGGQMVDNAAACGCPDGQQPKADGKLCEPRVGCRWKTVTCSSDKECKFDASVATDDGTCTAKKGCAFGTVTCTSNQDCDTSKSANGECVDKKGCQYLNPACSKNQTCNPTTGVCDENTASTGGATTLPGSSTSKSSVSSAPTANALGGLNCCCLPTAGGTALVGLAIYRRKNDADDSQDEE